MDAADPDKRGNMKLMDQGREADNEFEEGKSVSTSSYQYFTKHLPLCLVNAEYFVLEDFYHLIVVCTGQQEQREPRRDEWRGERTDGHQWRRQLE